jgi:ribonuclease Z
MTLTFLGTSACRFDDGDDTVHYLINDSILIDTGWFATANLKGVGVDPLSVKHLLFTHLHHDHYLGLPGFLFYLKCYKASGSTTIYGPAADVRRVVGLAEGLLQRDRFYSDTPEAPVVELPDQGSMEIDDITISYITAPHPVDARSYLFEAEGCGRIGISGDTTYNPALSELFKDCDLIIHEASLGACTADSRDNPALHAGAVDAARIAETAGAKRLVLVHGSREGRDASLEAARSHFTGDVSWPEPGLQITI